MNTKTICTGTNPNVCNAMIIGPDNMPICELTNKICEDYHLPTCNVKIQITQMFEEIKEGV